MRNNHVVAVVGPTASGKTALAVELALRLNGEIISADSMQIYKHMDIATAKPTPDEMKGVPHHLLDFLDPSESFSVARFCELAHPIIADIRGRGKLPIVAGGTGLYIDSLLGNTAFTEIEADPELREALQRELDEKGVDAMLEQIRAFDPKSAERLSVGRNPKRMQRCYFSLQHERYFLWCPKLGIEMPDGTVASAAFGITNTLSYDGKTLYQATDKYKAGPADDILRVTFARGKDELGRKAYRFIGVFKLIAYKRASQ